MNKRKLVISAILTILILALGMIAFRFLGSKKAPVKKNFAQTKALREVEVLSLIHISEPTRPY